MRWFAGILLSAVVSFGSCSDASLERALTCRDNPTSDLCDPSNRVQSFRIYPGSISIRIQDGLVDGEDIVRVSACWKTDSGEYTCYQPEDFDIQRSEQFSDLFELRPKNAKLFPSGYEIIFYVDFQTIVRGKKTSYTNRACTELSRICSK